MEQIAMAASIAQPATDAKPTGGAAGAAGGGLFRALMACELANGSAEIKTNSGKQAGIPGGLVALWLTSQLSQEISAATVPQDKDGMIAGAQPAEQQPDSPEATPASPDLGGLAAVLMQMIQANPQAETMLRQFADTGSAGGGEVVKALALALAGGNGPAQLPARLTAQQKEGLAAALRALAPASDGAQAIRQGNGEAIQEIRQLFSELIAEAPADRQAQAAQTAPEAIAAEPETVPQPAARQAAAAGAEPARGPFAGGRFDRIAGVALNAAGPVMGGAQAQGSEQGASGKGAAESHADTGAKAEPAAPDAKKQQAPMAFHPAFRAVQAETHTAAPDAPDKAQAIAAARPGAEAFDSIVQSITGLKDSPAKEMQIQLKPEFLGKVVISLSMGEGGLVAKIAAANPRVQDAFLTQAATLQSALADQGLKDVRVVVTSTSVQDPNLQQQADRRGQGQDRQHKRNRFAVEALEPQSGAVAQAYEAVMRPGAINYLA